MMKYRYHRNVKPHGLVHVMFLWDSYDRWQWPIGHVDAALRVTAVCEEAPVTCFTCLVFMR